MFLAQHDKNKGKCGVCGDNYADPQPRKHEAGGEFGNGIVGREYVVGQVNTSFQSFQMKP